MKISIIYFSHSGNNEKLALYLKEKLMCSAHKITEKKKRKTITILFDFLFKRGTKLATSDYDLRKYDAFIFVSPVWGCKIATPLRTFIDKEKDYIQKFSFISICNGEKGQKEKLIEELSSVFQKNPIVCTELSINKLLPKEKQNKIKYTFNYRVSDNDLKYYEDEIEEFLKGVENEMR